VAKHNNYRSFNQRPSENRFEHNNEVLVPVDEWFKSDLYVDHAEQVISGLRKHDNKFVLSTTQIRNLLILAAALHDEVQFLRSDNEKLTPSIIESLNRLRIQFVYQSGRDRVPSTGVKEFVRKAQLLEVLEKVNDKVTALRFCSYMESLVAYFTYKGGK
jgi:CRISPR type III-A-associated protein Csm2